MLTRMTTYRSARIAAAIAGLALVGACATRPVGPRTLVMPAPNKPYEVFQQDEAFCRAMAEQQSGGNQAAQRANDDAVKGALLGTLAGAAVGAVASAGSGGRGAAPGAAIGAVAGTALGAGSANRSVNEIERDYDRVYVQCMYSRGNQVPGFHSPASSPASAGAPPPPPAGSPPPPPPGVRK